VTKHSHGNVYFPSISSDGKVIVYEGDFGIWKLETASGRATEVKVDISADEKENEHGTGRDQQTKPTGSTCLRPAGGRDLVALPALHHCD